MTRRSSNVIFIIIRKKPFSGWLDSCQKFAMESVTDWPRKGLSEGKYSWQLHSKIP